MLYSFINIKTSYKLLIPISVLVTTVGAIVWIAESGMAEMKADTDRISSTLAVRQELGLKMIGNFNDAAIQEKVLLTETDELKSKDELDRFNQQLNMALSAVDQLIALADTPARVQVNTNLKKSILHYRDLADRSIYLSLHHDKAAAVQLSMSDVVAARSAFVAQNDELIVRREKEMEKTHADSTELGQKVIHRLYLFASIGLAFSLSLLAFIIIFLVVRPLSAMTRSLQRLAAGDLTVEVQGTERRDEIGTLAQSLQVFKDSAFTRIRFEEEAAERHRMAAAERTRREESDTWAAEAQSHVVTSVAAGLTQLAAGDLTCRLDQAFLPEYERLRTDFNSAMGHLADAMRGIVGNADAIRSGTGEIVQASDDLSRRIEQQAASLEQTAAALDQITATVKKTADGANHARQVVSAARAGAERSGQVVSEAVEAMSSIERSSIQIGQIIGVIDEIAFQTNLLALNAGVEAARAGEAGRGFAVVASEVRALAQRSAEAAKEIKALISASTAQVSQGVKLVGATGKALVEISEQVAEIDIVVSDIANSAQEQSTGLQQVNTAVNQMDQVTQKNAAMVEETTAAAHSLAKDAENQAELIHRFQVWQTAASDRGPGRLQPRPSKAVSAMKVIGRGGAVRKTDVTTQTQNRQEFQSMMSSG